MDIDDLRHVPVFPQFVAVPQFDIRKAILIVMGQGGKVQILIFQEIIAPASVAAVTVADDDVAAVRRKRKDGGVLKGFAKTGMKAHRVLLFKRPAVHSDGRNGRGNDGCEADVEKRWAAGSRDTPGGQASDRTCR